jgi:uncharacterized delta-60 repeat protein
MSPQHRALRLVVAAAAAVAATCAVLVAHEPSSAAPGSASAGRLDPRFGEDGVRRTSFGARADAGIVELLVQHDGKMVAVGTRYTGVDSNRWRYHIVLARYEQRGELDNRFGNHGTLVSLEASATAAAVQRDGKLVIVGAIDVPSTDAQDLLVLRLRPDGTRDPTFGKDGVATADLAPASPDVDFACAVAIQPDGRVVVAAQTDRSGSATGDSLALVRFDTGGRLDRSFGTNGVAVPRSAASRSPRALLVQQTGRIVVGGGDGTTSGRAFIARFHADGRVDRSIGTRGEVLPGHGAVRALLPTGDGGFVAVGSLDRHGGFASATRFDSRGGVDSSFGAHGRTTTAVAGSMGSSGAYAAAFDARNRVVIAGGNGGDFLVVRLTPDGDLDRTFGGTGAVTLDLGKDDHASAALVMPNGTIVAAGTSTDFNRRGAFALVGLTGAGRGGTEYASMTAAKEYSSTTPTKVLGLVRIRWRTAVEDGTRAFSVHRGTERVGSLLTPTPLLARGHPARYEFVDSEPFVSPDRPVCPLGYWLEERRTDGTRAWFGPIMAAPVWSCP